MPVTTKKIGNFWYVVEADSGRKSPHSGRHETEERAAAQARAINASLHKKKK